MLKRNYLSRKGPQVQATGEDGQGNTSTESREGEGERKVEGGKRRPRNVKRNEFPTNELAQEPVEPSSRLGGAGKCKNFRQGINCCLVVLFRCLVEDTQQQ